MIGWMSLKSLKTNYGDHIEELKYDKNYVYVVPKGTREEILNDPIKTKLECLIYNRFSTALAFVTTPRLREIPNTDLEHVGPANENGVYEVYDYIDGTPVYISKISSKILIAAGRFGDYRTPERALKFLKKNHSMYDQLLDMMTEGETYTFMAVGTGLSKHIKFERFNLVMIGLMKNQTAKEETVVDMLFQAGTLLPTAQKSMPPYNVLVKHIAESHGLKGLAIKKADGTKVKVYTQGYKDKIASLNKPLRGESIKDLIVEDASGFIAGSETPTSEN